MRGSFTSYSTALFDDEDFGNSYGGGGGAGGGRHDADGNNYEVANTISYPVSI